MVESQEEAAGAAQTPDPSVTEEVAVPALEERLSESGVDYWRQMGLLDPQKVGNKEVHIIGVGATGSHLAWHLAKMGMFNLHLHDPDIVEAHNIPNQVFRIGDIGRLKVEALQEIIEQATGTRPSIYPEAFTGDSALKGVVFLMVDTMNDRKEIWDKAIRMKFAVELMIETRMDIDNGRIYTIRPQSPAQARFWEQNWYPDGEAEESACTTRSISPTVGFIASLAAWKLIKWLNGEQIQKELISLCQACGDCHRLGSQTGDKKNNQKIQAKRRRQSWPK